MNTRPNVLLLVLGGARPERFSCAGYGRETTPFLDEMSRQGIRFTHALSTSPWGPSAHASLLSGLFPSGHGATSESGRLPETRPLLSEYLKSAGYRTAAFGCGARDGGTVGFARGFDRFQTVRAEGRIAGRAAHLARRASDRVLGRRDSGARRTIRGVLEWIGAGEAPFFGCVHLAETELRLRPPAPYDRTFMPREFTEAAIRGVDQDVDAWRAGASSFGPDDAVILSALYDGALRYLDMRLKELADRLAAAGRWEDTLLVVTADHGEGLGEHGVLGHDSSLHDSVLRVPLIIRCPRRVPGGFVVEEFAQPTDLEPTILELLGLGNPQEPVHGRTLLRGGHVTPGPAFVVAESFRPDLGPLRRRFPDLDLRPFDVRRKAIRTRGEKFVWQSDEANEFYDLARDPGEERNRVASEPDRAERMRRRLFDWFASIEPWRADLSARPGLETGGEGQLELVE